MSFNVCTFKIILNVPESDLFIEGLDMEFKIIKSVKTNADSAEIVIWNLDDDSYKALIQKDQPIYVYTQIDNNEAVMIFMGYLDSNHVTRKRITVTKTNNEAAPPDIVTVIKLVESRTAYDNTFINENYRENVSAKQIIEDCITAMGLGSVIINSEIPEKIYTSFKAIGKPHCILSEICSSIGLETVIQNGIVYIGSPQNSDSENDIPEFDLSNSLSPQFQNNNEVLLITSLQENLAPNQLIRCNYVDLEGTYRVLETLSVGNNFDTACTTYITIGLKQ